MNSHCIFESSSTAASSKSLRSSAKKQIPINDDFKLIEFHDDSRVELYNVREDIAESHDLASSQPETAKRLRARLHAWREEVGAQMPVPNPHYDPKRPQYDPKRPQPPAGERPKP